jgi:hypothetical protein
VIDKVPATSASPGSPVFYDDALYCYGAAQGGKGCDPRFNVPDEMLNVGIGTTLTSLSTLASESKPPVTSVNLSSHTYTIDFVATGNGWLSAVNPQCQPPNICTGSFTIKIYQQGTSPDELGRFAFNLDAPTDSHNPLEGEASYLLRKSLNDYRLSGSGRLDGSPSSYVASGTITYVDQRKIGADINLTLAVSGTATVANGTIVNGIERTQVQLMVRVASSDSSSFAVGATGTIALDQSHPAGTNKDQVFVILCGQDDTFTNDLWIFEADQHAVKVVLTGPAFRCIPATPNTVAAC